MLHQNLGRASQSETQYSLGIFCIKFYKDLPKVRSDIVKVMLHQNLQGASETEMQYWRDISCIKIYGELLKVRPNISEVFFGSSFSETFPK